MFRFIQHLQDDPQHYFMVVITVIISIVLHELAHGWMAYRVGDDTPYHTGHMTGNPLVHMGPFSLAALLLSGMAWGQMPVDPTRMRGKYAEAKVAFAGPAINLSLAILTLTALGFWHRSELQTIRSELPPLVERMVEQPDNPSNEGAIDRFFDERFGDRSTQENAQLLLWIFGVTNFVLFLFNLLPVPPLDGSAILANLHHGYATWLHEKVSPGLQMLLFAAAFCFSGYLFRVAENVASRYIGWVMTVG